MKHLPRIVATAVPLALAGVLLAPAVARAQDGPTVADYRQSIMQAFRMHMGGVGAALGDAAPIDHAEDHAVAFERMSQALAHAFPDGSAAGRALPTIWAERDDFMDKVAAIQTASARLVTASRSGDAETISAAMQGVRRTCSGCYSTYRGPAN